MDTFFEQIVAIKKTGKTLAAVIGIWSLTIILCLIILYFIKFLSSIGMLLLFGIIFGAIKLSGLLNIEYEYIVTNGTMDIDIITNKASRKRIASFELVTTSRLEKFNPSLITNIDKKSVIFACNADDENAYLLVAEKEGKSSKYIVFSPNQKMQSAIVKFLPKYIANNAFK